MIAYALITPAHNESAHIEKTIQSVCHQTILPLRWIIVSDGSTDATDDIVKGYAVIHPFIELIRREQNGERSYASKVLAFELGLRRVADLSIDFVGNLDGDVSFGPDYYEQIFQKFDRDPQLGIAAGIICEWKADRFAPRPGNRTDAVAGAVQVFRRDCFAVAGTYPPLKYGGEDWYTQIVARMNGWRVETFWDLPVNHHRPSGASARRWFNDGIKDYAMGSTLPFEVVRLARRVFQQPFVIGAAVRLFGFLCVYVKGDRRSIPERVIRQLRQDELIRMRLLVKKLFHFGSDVSLERR